MYVALSFCIDILIPATKPEWETVTYERALMDCKATTKEMETKSGNALSSKPLTSVDGPGDAPRPAPAAGVPSAYSGAAQQPTTSSATDASWGTHK